MVTYRRATVDDLEALVALRKEFLQGIPGNAGVQPSAQFESSLREYFTQGIATGNFVAWLCLDGDTIVGTSGICYYQVAPGFANPTGRVGYIMGMYTQRGYRRRGIAGKLFAAVIEEGRRSGIGKFLLHATDDGRPLYEKFGFHATKTEMVLPVTEQRAAF